MRELIVTFFCLWTALKLRKMADGNQYNGSPWDKAAVALRISLVTVTFAVSSFFGLSAIATTGNMPSVYSLTVIIILTALVMMGAELEITGNVVADAIVMAAGIGALCLTAVIGMPILLAWLNYGRFCLLFLAAVLLAIVVRALMWLNEEENDEHEER